MHDIHHGGGGAGDAFTFVLLKSVIFYLFGLGCVEDQVGFLPPCGQMFYLDVDPGGVDDCINVKLTLHKHFGVVNIEEIAQFRSS